jgi:uncharacterized integral membrane protein (TIGR00697 family)
MLDTVTHHRIHLFHLWPPEALSLLTLGICGVGILGLFRFYGMAGLFAYQAMAVVIGNVQVLQISQFGLFNEPMALGNVVFATTFLVSDILAEHFGATQAKRAVMISFWAQIWVTVFMVISLGHSPLIQTPDANLALMADKNYQALLQIFTPSMRILLASLTAYVLAQWFDIWVLGAIRRITGARYVWLRQNLSMFLAGLLDNMIFTALAWVVLSSTPVGHATLWKTYILPALIFRIVISFCATPIIYLSYRVKHDTTHSF